MSNSDGSKADQPGRAGTGSPNGTSSKHPGSGNRIEALWRSRGRHHGAADLGDHVADAATAFSGSNTFVVLHAFWFAFWIIYNLLAPSAFDPFPFGLLTLIVSLEAIFLSTFVLISQKKQAASTDSRNQIDFEVDIQADVWSEMIAEKLGVDRAEVQRRVDQRVREARQQAS